MGASPLHLAAQYGHRSTAEVLLRAGICKDARTKVDRTPLHMAATEGHELIVDLLIRVRLLYTCGTVCVFSLSLLVNNVCLFNVMFVFRMVLT